MLLNFTQTQIDGLLPAFVHIDRGLEITAIGSAISRYMPQNCIGTHFARLFSINNSDIPHFFQDWQGLKPIQIALRDSDLSLSGTAVFHDDGCLLTIRFVLSEKAFENGSMNLSDFGHSDPMVLNTMLIALQRSMLEEAQATALELTRERQRSADMFRQTSRVAGYMAHDFNNLLSIIRLNAERLSGLSEPDTIVSKLANIIHKTACRGAQATESLMALSHQYTGTLQAISVDNVIKDNVSIFQSVVGSGVKLSLNLDAEKYQSILEYNELLGAFINLLINARDALPNGGHISISTTVASDNSTDPKDVVPVEHSRHIAIRIADDGIGMSDVLLKRAFEPRFSSKANGTGLGLASVRNIALGRGGDVTLESAIGKGTVVHLHLPVARQPAPPLSAELDAADGGKRDENSTQRILLVEDEPYALEALFELLEANGYIVTACKSGEEALEALERDEFDILLTDIVMPGLSGTEVARQAAAEQPAIKVILMSGYVPDRDTLQPDWILFRKPMDTAALLQILAR